VRASARRLHLVVAAGDDQGPPDERDHGGASGAATRATVAGSGGTYNPSRRRRLWGDVGSRAGGSSKQKICERACALGLEGQRAPSPGEGMSAPKKFGGAGVDSRTWIPGMYVLGRAGVLMQKGTTSWAPRKTNSSSHSWTDLPEGDRPRGGVRAYAVINQGRAAGMTTRVKPESIEDLTTLGRIGKWVREHLLHFALGASLALAGVVADRFSDEAYAWLRQFFLEGVTGTYTLETFDYDDQTPPNFVPVSSTIELKDGGGTVFGINRTNITSAEYKLHGYHRVRFLLMAYGTPARHCNGAKSRILGLENLRRVPWRPESASALG
jgi:hypothetical protein